MRARMVMIDPGHARFVMHMQQVCAVRHDIAARTGHGDMVRGLMGVMCGERARWQKQHNSFGIL